MTDIELMKFLEENGFEPSSDNLMLLRENPDLFLFEDALTRRLKRGEKINAGAYGRKRVEVAGYADTYKEQKKKQKEHESIVGNAERRLERAKSRGSSTKTIGDLTKKVEDKKKRQEDSAAEFQRTRDEIAKTKKASQTSLNRRPKRLKSPGDADITKGTGTKETVATKKEDGTPVKFGSFVPTNQKKNDYNSDDFKSYFELYKSRNAHKGYDDATAAKRARAAYASSQYYKRKKAAKATEAARAEATAQGKSLTKEYLKAKQAERALRECVEIVSSFAKEYEIYDNEFLLETVISILEECENKRTYTICEKKELLERCGYEFSNENVSILEENYIF